MAVSGLFFEDNSESLKIALQEKIEFAQKDKTQQYFKKLGFENIDSKIFFEGKSVTADFLKGEAEVEIIKPRYGIKETNFLHLNNPKKLWTYVADIFAVALIFLAVSGLFVLKGKKGFEGRGKWLMLLGFLIPIIFLIIYL